MCDYDFSASKEKTGKVTGHFTQVVWKGSTELGIGFATGNDKQSPSMKCVYVVGRYKPAGNMIGANSGNVMMGSFNEATTCSKNGQGNQSPGGNLPSSSFGQGGVPSGSSAGGVPTTGLSVSGQPGGAVGTGPSSGAVGTGPSNGPGSSSGPGLISGPRPSSGPRPIGSSTGSGPSGTETPLPVKQECK